MRLARDRVSSCTERIDRICVGLPHDHRRVPNLQIEGNIEPCATDYRVA